MGHFFPKECYTTFHCTDAPGRYHARELDTYIVRINTIIVF
jgi:hypothetical protein